MVNGFLSLCAHKANERNEAAARVGEYAAVEGVFAKLLTSKAGNTFLNIGAAYLNQTFTGWRPEHCPKSAPEEPT
jgi:hypothetical protein